MTTISYTEARDRLANAWDQTISTREPVVIDRRGHESVVLVPASEWEGLLETAHLLRSPANARRLLPEIPGAIARKYCGSGHGGYALYLFDQPALRHAAIAATPEPRAAEPFCRV